MTEKAHLKMHLLSDSYECEEEHDIDAGQWERIQRVIHGTEAMTENAHNGLAQSTEELIKRLRAYGIDLWANVELRDTLIQAIAALRAREAYPSEGAQRDAERYLWLRDEAQMLKKEPCVMRYGWPEDVICGEELDAAIDAALSRRPA